MIEILVVRDPDSADDITVWVDGVDVTNEATTIYVDAGAGWEYEDWQASASDAMSRVTSGAAYKAVLAAFDDPPGRQYIDGFPDPEEAW